MTQSEERYAHLLQPIRDLAANWSVNIANDLEDYLEVLESVQFSFAEGGPSLNFAEAALLIQGSACIYSKKVEYLHTLVYQALEFIADRRKRDTHTSKALGEEEGAAADVDSEFEDEEQFLSLDDVLEEGTGIDLDEGAAVALPAALRPPATLLALEDTGNSHGDGDAGNYRIAACTVHRSGALLLEQRDGAHLDEHLQPMSSEVGNGQGGAAAPYWAPSAAAGAAAAAGPGLQEAQQDWAASGGAADLGGGGFDMADDDYDMGGGGGFDDDDYYGPVDPGGDGGPAAAQLAVAAGEYQHPGAGPQAQPGEEPGGEEESFDPYKPLDPNSRGTLKPKPFKKAARVPRKLLARRQHQQQEQQHMLLHDLESLLALHPPVTGLLFPEFSYALKEQEGEAKPSQPGGRGGSRASSQRSAQTVAAPAFTYEEAVAGFAAEEAGEGADGADLGADFFDGGGFDHDDDDYAPLGDFDVPEGAVPLAAAGLEASLGGPLGDAGDFGDAGGVDELSYEELCRAHIEAFISAAAAAEVQSELASRVSGWRSKMAPVLEEEDARAEFDIHAYGERILQRLEQLSCAEELSAEELRHGQLPPTTFGQVVGVGPKFEASRSFSSMLQLVNNGNVRITKLGAGGEEGFTLTLLDRVLPHKKVTDYRALGGAAAQQGPHVQKAGAAQGPAAEQPSGVEVENQGPAQKVIKAAKAGGKGNKRRKG